MGLWLFNQEYLMSPLSQEIFIRICASDFMKLGFCDKSGPANATIKNATFSSINQRLELVSGPWLVPLI